MNLTILSIIFFDLLNAKYINFEETRKKCNKHDPKVIKESYDVFKGYSEEVIPVKIDIKNEVSMNIPDEYFNDTTVIRFKVIGWNHESYIYMSKFFINGTPCELENAKNLLEFYSKVTALMNKDKDFNNVFYQICYNTVNERLVRDCSYDARRRSIELKLFGVYEKKILFKGNDFDLFKLICVTLFEQMYSKDDLTKPLEEFSKKDISEIYSVESSLYQVIKNANESLNYTAIIEKYGNKYILKDSIKEL